MKKNTVISLSMLTLVFIILIVYTKSKEKEQINNGSYVMRVTNEDMKKMSPKEREIYEKAAKLSPASTDTFIVRIKK